jgi:hypothetical protein
MTEKYLDEPRIVEILREAMREGPKSINELAAIAARAGADNVLQWETEQGKDNPCDTCFSPERTDCPDRKDAYVVGGYERGCIPYAKWEGHRGGKRGMAQWITARCRERVIAIEKESTSLGVYEGLEERGKAAAFTEVQDWLSKAAQEDAGGQGDGLDVCACGDFRHQHENGTGKCNMPDDLCHGMEPCLQFRSGEAQA